MVKNLQNLKNNKWVENLKHGFQDIQTVSQEGNFKLFVKQIVVVALVILVFRYANNYFSARVNNLRGQMDAIQVEKSSEQDYLRNKQLLVSLEPRFPDTSKKNEWLLSRILDIFQKANLKPQMEGSQSENDSNPTYLTASQQVGMNMGFPQFAEFLAGVENLDEYIKVSDFSITKETDPNRLGDNRISIRFNTIFLKEKIAPSLFKDYDALVAQAAQQ